MQMGMKLFFRFILIPASRLLGVHPTGADFECRDERWKRTGNRAPERLASDLGGACGRDALSGTCSQAGSGGPEYCALLRVDRSQTGFA